MVHLNDIDDYTANKIITSIISTSIYIFWSLTFTFKSLNHTSQLTDFNNQTSSLCKEV